VGIATLDFVIRAGYFVINLKIPSDQQTHRIYGNNRRMFLLNKQAHPISCALPSANFFPAVSSSPSTRRRAQVWARSSASREIGFPKVILGKRSSRQRVVKIPRRADAGQPMESTKSLVDQQGRRRSKGQQTEWTNPT
jgi:hypothetical protein